MITKKKREEQMPLSKIFFLVFFLAFINHGFAVEESGIFAESSTDNPSPEDKTNNKASEVLSKVSDKKDEIRDLLLNKKPSSLMFNEEESESINRAIDSLNNNQVYTPENKKSEEAIKETTAVEVKKEEENEKSYIYLASIIYFTAEDWVVWLNDQKITPQTNNKNGELYLKSVQKDYVEVYWKLSISKWKVLSGKNDTTGLKINTNNQVEVNFTLKPNQTFILGTNSIAEGRAVVALMQKKQKEKVTKEDLINTFNKE